MRVDEYVVGGIPLENLLAGISDEKEREFENSLASLASIHERARLLADLRRILTDSKDERLRYAAFYCLNILHRRSKDYSILENLINQYEPTLGKHDTFSHLVVIFKLERGDPRDKDEILAKSFENYDRLPGHAGIVHMFSDAVATLCEDSNDEVAEKIAKDWLERAIEAVKKAKHLDSGYAKFYCTHGRLLAVQEEYDEALELIKQAIDKENSANADYAIRIGNYQIYRQSIQAKRNERNLAAKMEQRAEELRAKQDIVEEQLASAVRRMDESVLKNLEFLGFFAGLISFTIGSIQIAAGQGMQDAALLIVVLMGALLVAFAGFSFILERTNRHTVLRAAIVGGVGATVLVVGLTAI